MTELPSGTVTFLMTDLEGSTRLWEEHPDAMRAALARHDQLLEQAIAASHGVVCAEMGDGLAAVFSSARDALAASVAAQRALATEPWGATGPLRARIALHTDEGTLFEGRYTKQPLNRCSRLVAVAHGGQVVVSAATEMLVRGGLPEGAGLLDLGEHRLRDLGRPARVFQLNHPELRADFPPLRTLDSFPGNLPAQVSSFIGREAEVARILAALADARVVTLTGVGGVGKTRLALQVAAHALPRFREGAWLVELAPVRDPGGVIDAVAAAFRLTARGGQTLEQSLVDAFATNQLLLVIDNCEHVLGAVARWVARIERSCPEVTVLATSREGLAIEGEQILAVPALAAGQPGDELERLLHTDAVRLFVERARAVKADFALSPGNAAAVVEVCQRLDGVPLAIELAASRVIALSPAELARRLDRRFSVLAGGRRGAVERHATLRAAIDWSYELLGAAEQRLLARLAVFTGGCTLEAVEGVCAGDPVERDTVFDLVAGLVARSLVVAEDHDLGTRYRLLETIRQYGEERLAEHGETDALRARHAEFYVSFVEQAGERLHGPEQLRWGRRLGAEFDNALAALSHALDTGDADLAVRLVASHEPSAESVIGEFRALPALRVLELPGAPERPAYRLVLMSAALQASDVANHTLAEQCCQRALEADGRRLGEAEDRRLEARACFLRARLRLSAGCYAEAADFYGRGAELERSAGHLGRAAVQLGYSVNTRLLAGEDGKAVSPVAEEAVALARRAESPGALALCLSSLALTLVDSDAERARALLRESVERGAIPGQEFPFSLWSAILAAGRLQDWNLTLALAGRSLRLYRWMLSPITAATNLAECARALAESQPETAAVLQGAAYAAFGRANPDAGPARPPGSTANFVLRGLRETGALAAAALGPERARELRAQGVAMNTDQAIAYALAHIDPKLLVGPLPS